MPDVESYASSDDPGYDTELTLTSLRGEDNEGTKEVQTEVAA